MTWEFPATVTTSDTIDKESVDCFSSLPPPIPCNCHIRDTSRAAAPPFPLPSQQHPSHIIPFSASAVFWRNPRIISELPQGSVSTGQLASYFRVPTSRRVLSCRKKMSFSRRDPSWFPHQLPSNHDRFLALFSNIRFASLAHRTLAGSRKAHEWDGSFSSRDLSSHIFCGSASYFVTRRLSAMPLHSDMHRSCRSRSRGRSLAYFS